jgi:hypothetical protein
MTFKIDIKGYVPVMEKESYLQEYADIKIGYSSIVFNGTREQLDELLDKMMKDETYFKVIGVHNL